MRRIDYKNVPLDIIILVVNIINLNLGKVHHSIQPL